MTGPSYKPLLQRSNNFVENQSGHSGELGSQMGEPMVSSLPIRPPGKPSCPPALSRLRIEKIEGGLVVAGCVVANNCQIILPVFGVLFMLIGCVLTAASYRGCGEDEERDHYEARIALTGKSRILGPICIVAGAIMAVAGVGFCLLTRSAERKQRRLAFHCPIHGDFYPISPYKSRLSKRIDSPSTWVRVKSCLCLRRDSNNEAPPRCPRSASPDPARPAPVCPPALPFVVPSDSVVGLQSVLGVTLTPEQTFGSIRSLVTSREVASFPMSRTPSPPPIREVPDDISVTISELDNESDIVNNGPKMIECKLSTTEIVQSGKVTPNDAMKSATPTTVRIIVPEG